MIYAEYIDYMDAYRLFRKEQPQRTMAYADSIEEAERIAREQLREDVKEIKKGIERNEDINGSNEHNA